MLAWLLCSAAAAQPALCILPAEVQAALAAAKLPPEALAVVVADAEAPSAAAPGLACSRCR